MACFAGVDMDGFAARVTAFAEERGLHARLRALCGAGDRDAAQAYADAVEAEFYGRRSRHRHMRACLERAGFFAGPRLSRAARLRLPEF